jgi:hypothetical protein
MRVDTESEWFWHRAVCLQGCSVLSHAVLGRKARANQSACCFLVKSLNINKTWCSQVLTRKLDSERCVRWRRALRAAGAHRAAEHSRRRYSRARSQDRLLHPSESLQQEQQQFRSVSLSRSPNAVAPRDHGYTLAEMPKVPCSPHLLGCLCVSPKFCAIIQIWSKEVFSRFQLEFVDSDI